MKSRHTWYPDGVDEVIEARRHRPEVEADLVLLESVVEVKQVDIAPCQCVVDLSTNTCNKLLKVPRSS